MLLASIASSLLPTVSDRWVRGVGIVLIGGVLVLAAGSAHAQDVIVDDDGQAALPTDCAGTGTVDATIQGGIATASSGQTIFVCPGTYAENVTVGKSVTLQGNNVGTPGSGSRGAETVVDAGGSFGVGFMVEAADVTIDGFRLIGDQGILLNDSGNNGWVGLTVQNNLAETDLTGVQVENLTTTASQAFVIQENQFALQRQEFEDPTASTSGVGNDLGEQTASIVVSNIDGTAQPTLSNNIITDNGSQAQDGVSDPNPSGRNDGSMYGYVLRGANVSNGPVTISGGTISGTMQAIAILDGQIVAPSNFRVENVIMNGFAGVANDDRVNFHAGIFVFTGNDSGSTLTTTGEIENVTVEETDVPDTVSDPGGFQPSAGIYFGGFSAEFADGNFFQSVSVTNATVRNNANRGIFARGDNVTATVTQSTITGNGNSPASGNPGTSVFGRQGASLTVTESEITAGASATSVLQADNFESQFGNDPGALSVVVSGSTVDRSGSADFLSTTGQAAAGSIELNAAENAYADAGVLVKSGSTINTNSAIGAASVDFNPFLDSLTDTDGATAGFQADRSSLRVTPLGDQIGTFTDTQRIAEGLNAVNAGGTVIADAGTFEENLIITKSNVTIEGVQAGTAAGSSRGTESIVIPATSDGTTGVMIDIQASNVTLDGLELDANNTTISAGADAAIGILMDASTTAGLSGVTVQNTIVRNIPSLNSNPAGGIIGIGSSSGNVIRQNLLTSFGDFDGSTTPESTNAGIGLRSGFFATVENNVSNNVAFGILMYTHDATASVAPQTISGGTHSNNYRGIVVYPGQVDSEYLIDGVTTSNNQQHGITVFRFNGFGVQGTGTGSNTVDATIQNVTVANNGNESSDASGINVSASVTGGQYTVVVKDSDILDNQNRGVNARATDDTSIDVTVQRSTLLGNGHTPFSSANANGAIAQRGAVLTIENSILNNRNTNTSTDATDADAVASQSEGSQGDNGRVTITNSQILAPVGQAAVLSGGSAIGFLDASGNWWGSTDPSTFAISDGADALDFTPFLESGTDTDGGTAGFQGDFSALVIDSGSEQTGAITRFEEAVTLGSDDAVLRAISSNTLTPSGAEFSIPSGGVTLDGDLIVDGDLIFSTSSGSIAVPGELAVDQAVASLTNSPTFILQDITEGTSGFGSAGSPGADAGWRMYAVPRSAGDGTVLGDDLDFSTEVGTILYTFDESAQDYVAGDGTSGTALPSGRGFFLYLFDDDLDPIQPSTPLTLDAAGPLDVGTAFPTDGSIGTADLDVSLADVSGAPTATDGSKVHLLGNPFAQSFDISNLTDSGTPLGGNNEFLASVQVWDPVSTTYEVVNVNTGSTTDVIAPWQGFWVERDQTNGTGGPVTLTFESTGRTRGAPFVPAKSAPQQEGRMDVAVTLTDTDGSVLARDRSILYFRDDVQVGSDSYDATKYAPFISSGEYVQLAFADPDIDGRPLIQRSLPANLGSRIGIPTTIETAGLSGQAHVSVSARENVPEAWTLFLTDTVADSTLALDPGVTYSFDLAATKSAAPLSGPVPRTSTSTGTPRFQLTLSPNGTIPVELADFSGSADGRAAVLQWRTASETNNAGFHVERKTPEGYVSEAFVDGAGTTDAPQTYRARIEDLDVGTHTFRLRQVDLDGTATTTDPIPVAVALDREAAVSQVYPNPTPGTATVKVAVREAQQVRVDVFDLLGRRVARVHDARLPAGETVRINLSGTGWGAGHYFVRVRGERFQETRRVVVLR